MIDLSAPGARLLRPRTLFGRILHFLAAAILWFLVVGTLLVLVQSLGLGKPKASITTPLFLFSLILLWKALVPSGKELRDFREAEQAKDRARREAALQTAAAAGDAKAAIALGDLYRDGLGSQKDLARALHHYEGAAATGSASAQKAVAAAREELAQSEADRRRAALEAEVPAVLDAQCPNCAAPLSASSHKCHSCGAVFFVSADGWQPIPVSVGPASMPPAAPNQGERRSRLHWRSKPKFPRRSPL